MNFTRTRVARALIIGATLGTTVGLAISGLTAAATAPEPPTPPDANEVAFTTWSAENGIAVQQVSCDTTTVTICYGIDPATGAMSAATLNPDGVTFTPLAPAAPTTVAPAAPTTSTTVAPAAPVGDVGTRTNPVPIGTAADVGNDWAFTVDSVDRDAWAAIHGENMFNEQPPDGHVYVLAHITTTYNGPDRDSIGFSFDVSGVTSSNVEADAGFVMIPDELDVYREVFSGGSNSGNIALLVPENEVASLVIYVSSSFGGSDAVYFSTTPGLFPIGVGSDGPAVAAIQGQLGLSADCDFGDQTRAAVEQWQTSVGRPATGSLDPEEWSLLQVPATWGTDTNANGQVDPDEISLICDGNVEFPAG